MHVLQRRVHKKSIVKIIWSDSKTGETCLFSVNGAREFSRMLELAFNWFFGCNVSLIKVTWEE